jgi:hypothetical protein
MVRTGQRAGRPLADPLGDKLVPVLQERGVEPLTTGQVSAATVRANQAALRQAVEAVGLDATVVADKDMARRSRPGWTRPGMMSAKSSTAN